MVTKSTPRTTAPQPSEHDIIDDMLATILSMAPDFNAAVLAQAEKKVRDKWAGDRPYIAKRSGEGSSERNAKIKADYLKGERIALLERRYHLSRARLWQIIKG